MGEARGDKTSISRRGFQKRLWTIDGIILLMPPYPSFKSNSPTLAPQTPWQIDNRMVSLASSIVIDNGEAEVEEFLSLSHEIYHWVDQSLSTTRPRIDQHPRRLGLLGPAKDQQVPLENDLADNGEHRLLKTSKATMSPPLRDAPATLLPNHLHETLRTHMAWMTGEGLSTGKPEVLGVRKGKTSTAQICL